MSPEPAEPTELPVRAALPRIADTLVRAGSAVLVAPPGTGKTTLVPPALAAELPGKVVVAEPRSSSCRPRWRPSCRARWSWPSSAGSRPGPRPRGWRRSPARRSAAPSVMRCAGTPAPRRPPGSRSSPRACCYAGSSPTRSCPAPPPWCSTSATSGTSTPTCCSRCCSTPATACAPTCGCSRPRRPSAPSASRSCSPPPQTRPRCSRSRPAPTPCPSATSRRCAASGSRGAWRAPCAPRSTRTTATCSRSSPVPPRSAAALAGVDADVLPLHGRLPPAEQDRALRPGPRRRVVLASAVAESSLTVPGVRAVVDSGLARVPRTDHRRGLAGLVTVRVSAAVAQQRAGRAGREAPGRVLRCWPEGELLAPEPDPEIRTADLTRLALDLACWGTPDGSGLRWWDPPPEGPLRAGREVLRALGALDGDAVTGRGRRMAELGLHPRLAGALLDGAAEVGARAAAEVVALLDDDTLAGGVELEAELRRLRSGSAPGAGRWRAEVRRLERQVDGEGTGAGRGDDPALVTALAHPERLARRRSP